MKQSQPLPTLRTMVPKRKKKRVKGPSLDDYLFTEPRNYTRREQAVWRAVIVQAITDALSRSKKREMQRYKREALVWLRGESRDFKTVCDNAGFDPAYIRDKVRELLQRHQQACAAEPVRRPLNLEPFQTPGQTASAFSLRMPTITTRLSGKIHLQPQTEESE